MDTTGPETTNDALNTIREQLADLVGGDLADSLVRAGRKRGAFDLDLHLLISDGVKALSQEKKRDVLRLLDAMAGK